MDAQTVDVHVDGNQSLCEREALMTDLDPMSHDIAQNLNNLQRLNDHDPPRMLL